MTTKPKECLVAFAVLLVVATGSVEDAKADYVLNVTPTEDEDGSWRVLESTYEEVGDGIADANAPWQTVSCNARAWTWADGDSAYLVMAGEAYLKYEWTWQGPPSTPPGGTFSWELDGDGDSVVDGNNLDGTYADASTYGIASGGVLAWNDFFSTMSSAGGLAFGYVYDDDLAGGEAYADGAFWSDPDEAPDYGFYHFSVMWNSLDYDDDETIPAETGYFYFQPGAQCQCTSGSEAASGSIAHTDTSADAFASSVADFQSN